MNDPDTSIPDAANAAEHGPMETADPALSTADLAAAASEPRRQSEDRSFAAEGDARATERADDDSVAPLLPSGQAGEMQTQWDTIQAGFVDEPRRAVEQADGLVASAMSRLAEVFAEERSRLERQWDRGDDVTTEDLRLALRRYRSFFSRLLSV